MPLTIFRRACLSLAAVTLVAVSAADEPASKDKVAHDVEVKDITLSVPADWKQEAPSNRLREAQFVIPAAEGDKQPTELVISYFGGTGGGVDQNIDRWIGQFGSAGKKVTVTTGKSKQGSYHFVDIGGTFNMPVGPPILRQTQELPDARMLGVILEVEGKGNYFLKMAGPAKSVAAAEDALRASFGADKKSEKEYELK